MRANVATAAPQLANASLFGISAAALSAYDAAVVSIDVCDSRLMGQQVADYLTRRATAPCATAPGEAMPPWPALSVARSRAWATVLRASALAQKKALWHWRNDVGNHETQLMNTLHRRDVLASHGRIDMPACPATYGLSLFPPLLSQLDLGQQQTMIEAEADELLWQVAAVFRGLLVDEHDIAGLLRLDAAANADVGRTRAACFERALRSTPAISIFEK